MVIAFTTLERAARAVGRFTLDLVLPPGCARCGTEVDAPGTLCPDCFNQTQLIAAPRCDHCGSPVPTRTHLGPGGCCVRCEKRPPVWSQARAAYVYDAGSRDLILALKYADRTTNAGILARQMHRAGRDVIEAYDMLVPVPLHWRRLFQRRYNQAALLARAVGKLAEKPVCADALTRPRATTKLAHFSPSERMREVREAIAVNPARAALITGRSIILVDDVLTTGATATACTSVLLAAGASRVAVLAAARTLRPDSEDADLPDWAATAL